jgi:large conductance mechanosensitive channel
MFSGFKAFITRGNVMELAVAVVIGATFTVLINAIVTGIFNPLIAAIFDQGSLDQSLIFTLPGGSKLLFGTVAGAAIQFLLTAAVVYFVVVMPLNRLKAAQERRRAAQAESEAAAEIVAALTDTTPTELELLREIRDLLAVRK